MADIRGAGAQSGLGGTFLDSGKAFSGVIGGTLRQDLPRARTPASHVACGDRGHTEVLSRAQQPNHQTGSIPRPGGRFQQVCIPGYRGHIAGKIAENVHGQTFGAENERASQMLPLRHLRRTTSAPELISAPGVGNRGLSVAPRVPGYAGTIPGKHSETVHALRFAEATAAATQLRESNPHVVCDGWLRRGKWPANRMATYKWSNRFMRLDAQDLFTPEQEQDSFEMNRRLGQTFGLRAPKLNRHKPGDRYLHSLCIKADADKESKRLDPTKQPAAGHPSASIMLDQQRWVMHNALALKNGNQRTPY